MNLTALHQLPTAALRTLSASLRQGMLAMKLARPTIQQIAGPLASDVEQHLQRLAELGMTPQHMAVVVDAIADERESRPDASRLFDLVLSGPDLPGIPTQDTGAVVQTLIAEAQKEILLITYAIHDGAHLFQSLAARMLAIPGLKVVFCIHIGRTSGDTSSDAQIVSRYAAEFRMRHWPWRVLPKVFYDPRSLIAHGDQRASMHAKCIVVDRRVALITSANFTEAAQGRNIEAGVLVRHEPTVRRLVDYFEGMRSQGALLECQVG